MKNVQLDHHQTKRHTLRLPVCILAHDIDVPMNVGSVFRIADAFGVEKIFLSGTSPAPPNNKIRKTARSTEKFVPYEYVEDAMTTVRQLKADGYRIISLEITSSSVCLDDFVVAPSDRICLVLGSENAGVNQDLLDVSECAVHIPMRGQNSSMNVAIACAVAVSVITGKYVQ